MMKTSLARLLLRGLLLQGLLWAVVWPTNSALAAEPGFLSHKIDPWVIETAEREGNAEFLVQLEEQADLSHVSSWWSKERKGRYVFNQLRKVAAESQPPVLAELAGYGVETRAFWISNMIWARGELAVVEAMAHRADVRGIHANPWVSMEDPSHEEEAQLGGCPPTGVTGGVSHTGAPDLWAQGIDGEGVVIGGQDTGYDWDHDALIGAYRGWNGATSDHNHNWHDSIHSGGGVCGADSPEPCDDNSHGSHTMGTMLGSTASTVLGMAPGAQWIGCRNMDQNVGTPATYAECFEWFLAPTDLEGMNPDPSKAPDVVNNSWGCPTFEGCTDPEVLKSAVENLRAAGVMVVASAGNSGPSCGSVATPAAIYDASFTVGNTDNFDSIVSTSSRGPVTVDGSNRIKPDISAPGVSVCSSYPGNTYGYKSGTSMAAPHVAGLVALLIDAQPCLRGQVDAIEQYIRDTAVPRTTSQTCGGVDGSSIPNNAYGYGAIRAVAPGAEVCGNMVIFSDDFESGDLGAWSSTLRPLGPQD